MLSGCSLKRVWEWNSYCHIVKIAKPMLLYKLVRLIVPTKRPPLSSCPSTRLSTGDVRTMITKYHVGSQCNIARGFAHIRHQQYRVHVYFTGGVVNQPWKYITTQLVKQTSSLKTYNIHITFYPLPISWVAPLDQLLPLSLGSSGWYSQYMSYEDSKDYYTLTRSFSNQQWYNKSTYDWKWWTFLAKIMYIILLIQL